MTRIESVCRMLRDVGIFMLGVAAVTMAVHYLFIRVDPVSDMQKAMFKNITKSFEKQLAENGN
jgi:hypothetical protein